MQIKRTNSSSADWAEQTERIAARTISLARSFADTLSREASRIGIDRDNLARMLQNFRKNNPFDHEDDDMFMAVGTAIVDALNAIAPGYSNAVLHGDTTEDWILDDRLAVLRRLLLQWDALRSDRRYVQSHVAARRFLSGQS